MSAILQKRGSDSGAPGNDLDKKSELSPLVIPNSDSPVLGFYVDVLPSFPISPLDSDNDSDE